MHIHSFVLVRPLTETLLKEGSGPRSYREQSLFEEEVQAQSIFSRLYSYGLSDPMDIRSANMFQGSTELPAAQTSYASSGWFGGDGIPDELKEEWGRFWHRLIYEFWAYKPFENNPRTTLAGNWTYIGGYKVGFDGYIFGDRRFYYEIGIRNTTMWDIAIFTVSLVFGVGFIGLIGGDVIGFAITKGLEWLADWLVDDEKANAFLGGLSTAFVGGASFTSNLGGELSVGWKTAGSSLSQGWKDAGGNLSDSAKQAGRAISQGWKDAGGAVSSGWKSAGGSLSKGWKNATGGIKL